MDNHEHDTELLDKTLGRMKQRIFDNLMYLTTTDERHYLSVVGKWDEIRDERYGIAGGPSGNYYLRALNPKLHENAESLDAEPAFKALLEELDQRDDSQLPHPRYFGESGSAERVRRFIPHIDDVSVSGGVQLGLFDDDDQTGQTSCYGLLGYKIEAGAHSDLAPLPLGAFVELKTVYIHPDLRGWGLGEALGIAGGTLVNEYLLKELLSPEVSRIRFPDDNRYLAYYAEYISREAACAGDPFGDVMEAYLQEHGSGSTWRYIVDVG